MIVRLFLRRFLAYTIGLPFLILMSLGLSIIGIALFIVDDDSTPLGAIQKLWVIE